MSALREPQLQAEGESRALHFAWAVCPAGGGVLRRCEVQILGELRPRLLRVGFGGRISRFPFSVRQVVLDAVLFEPRSRQARSGAGKVLAQHHRLSP